MANEDGDSRGGRDGASNGRLVTSRRGAFVVDDGPVVDVDFRFDDLAVWPVHCSDRERDTCKGNDFTCMHIDWFIRLHHLNGILLISKLDHAICMRAY